MDSNKNISAKKSLFRYILIIFVLSTGIISTVSIINLRKYKHIQDIKINKIISEKITEKITDEFQKASLTSQLISRNIENNNTGISEELKTKLENIIKSDTGIKGIFLFFGNPSLLTGSKENFLKDTVENLKTLSLIKTKKSIQSSFYAEDFKINQINIDKLTENKETLISEPFKIITGKNAEYIIGFTSPIFNKKNTVGFISVYYNTKHFISHSTTDKFSECNFILLSPEKNIILNSVNPQNLGKNILNLHGTEYNLYTKLHQNSKNISGNISKITINNTEFDFLSSCKLPSDPNYKNLLILYITLSFIVLILGTVFLIYLLKKSFLPLEKIFNSIKILSKGGTNFETPEKLKIEFKKATEDLNKISNFNNEISIFAEQIISENYDVYLKERSEIDNPAKALNKISAYLKNKKHKQTKEEQEVSLQLWMRKGRFEISEAERFSSKDIRDLSYNIIRSVVNYIEALMGGIYLYDKENETIELIAAYAYNKQKHFNAKFKPGEGIVGACILEKKKIILNHIPEDYIKISTGLGSGTPSYIAVIPIFFKNEINAVVEIAFMNKPEDYKIEFIEQLNDSIGAWIDASLISTKTTELLEISQKQTKELAEKEDELNKKVAELQEIQEKTDEINTRYKSMLNAVNQTIMTVEYTLDGTIINCNSVYTEIMGFEPKDIKNKNVLELVKDQSEGLKQIIEEVKTGKTVKQKVKRYTKFGEEKQLTATYTPYYDKEGKISQILFFAFDISNVD